MLGIPAGDKHPLHTLCMTLDYRQDQPGTVAGFPAHQLVREVRHQHLPASKLFAFDQRILQPTFQQFTGGNLKLVQDVDVHDMPDAKHSAPRDHHASGRQRSLPTRLVLYHVTCLVPHPLRHPCTHPQQSVGRHYQRVRPELAQVAHLIQFHRTLSHRGSQQRFRHKRKEHFSPPVQFSQRLHPVRDSLEYRFHGVSIHPPPA